jgi:hypothetical protein
VMSSLEKFFSRILDAVRQCIAIVSVIVCVALGSAIAQPSFQVKDEMGRVIQPGSLIPSDSNLTIAVDTDDKYLQVHASRQKRGAEIYFTERDLIDEVTGAEYETELNLLEAGFVSRMDYATRITIGLSEVNYDVPPLIFPGEQAPSEKKLEPLAVQDFWIANPLSQMEVPIRVSEQDAGFQTVSFDLPQSVWRAGHRVPNVDPVFYLILERLDRVTVDGTRWVGGSVPLMDAFVSVGANAHQFIVPDIPGGYRIRLIGDGFLFGETTFEVKPDPMPTLGDDAPSPDEIPVTQRSVRFDDRDRVQNIEQSSVISFRISNPKQCIPSWPLRQFRLFC